MTAGRGLAVVRDVLVVVGVALLTFQALRRHVGDYYRVPSRSMEPLLHGDPADGDVVFVGALGAAADCARGDLVVVRHPDGPESLLVKRIVARGDDPDACYIELREGDVWLGSDRRRLRREVKDPLPSRAMRVAWARWPAGDRAGGLDLAAASVAGDRLRLPPLPLDRDAVRALCRERAGDDGPRPLPAGAIGTARAVDATYVAADGARGREGEDVGVFDCGMELGLARAPATLVLGLETRHEVVAFVWIPAFGTLWLWRNGEDVAGAVLPKFEGGHRVEFGRLDNRLFFAVDGRADALLCHARPAAWDRPADGLPLGPRSRLFVAALGGPAELDSLIVLRDVFRVRDRVPGVPGQPTAWPVFVEPGHWFLLGDNAYDSRDSRQLGAVPMSAFAGRPWFVLGPWPRRRWLGR